MFNLDGKVALVTGAAGGLGSAIARSLYAAGATVVLSGRRVEILNTLAKELGDRAHVVTSDLKDKESVQGLVAAVAEKAGAVSILVNNAGLTKDNLFMRMKDEELDEVLDVNLKAPFYLSRAAMRPMMKARWGRIINISSIVGVTGNPGQANYCASKAGIIGLSKSLAQEVASRNITVNCVAPGFIESDMTDVLPDAQKEALLAGIPQGRMGKPEDIASAVLYLASEEASYVTGQTLHVNGGMAMI
ncbi:MAG: 3-oxoacyl-ACP reductase FabG [Alphaproteobacteria bacterium]|nr:3-oxoacyl-ACP reductase FabG [Alphaproteobacteria bacterium]NCQ67044.1 3-oxoacyl-ACP reductase FabG [Alphaproteobacteria bacterium]NCT07641.1 3-oxoacyl-ACP reductase FabG [Alphaproteobacteria bacterium]